MKLSVALAVMISCLAVSFTARSELYEVREPHYQMGTILDITVWHSDPKAASAIIRRCVREVHRLDKILSDYDRESSLSLFNRQGGKGKVRIDTDLHRLLTMANDFSLRTSGYFDVTVGPLVALWREAGEKGTPPELRALSQTLELVGFQKLKLHRTGEAELLNAGMKIDLGGIGKGFAVDRVVKILHEVGVERALVNFGGSSFYALGSPPHEASWTIGVKGISEQLVGVVHLKDRGLSTSGSMGRYWEIGGVRYGHLINPKSGLPATRPRSATAVAKTATDAEALTKPLVLLGRQGMAMIKDISQTESWLISESGEIYFSDGFVSATRFQRIEDR